MESTIPLKHEPSKEQRSLAYSWLITKPELTRARVRKAYQDELDTVIRIIQRWEKRRSEEEAWEKIG